MHGLGPTRTRVLSLLQSASDPLTVGTVAAALELHKNSARFHLDALVAAGYATRTAEPNGRTGRPPLLYAPTDESPTVSNQHLLELATALLDEFASGPDAGEERARRAGERWGRQARGTEEPTLAALKGHLARRGFGVHDDEDQLTFTRCPFRDIVSEDQLPMVCAVHQGLLEGFVEGSALRVGQLDVGPRVCTAAIPAIP